jgi:hypothetical protein
MAARRIRRSGTMRRRPAFMRFANGQQNAHRRPSGRNRVVVLRGNRVEEFDFESAQRKQLRGNIYLAKVTR